MSYDEIAKAWGVRYCKGGCGRSNGAHARGFIGAFWTIHWADRKVYRPGLLRFAYLVARARREQTRNYDPLYDWYNLWRDVMEATELLRKVGVRVRPSDWAQKAELMQLMAERRSATMPKEMRRWVQSAVRSHSANFF
jgi:hypothetical protein